MYYVLLKKKMKNALNLESLCYKVQSVTEKNTCRHLVRKKEFKIHHFPSGCNETVLH